MRRYNRRLYALRRVFWSNDDLARRRCAVLISVRLPISTGMSRPGNSRLLARLAFNEALALPGIRPEANPQRLQPHPHRP